MSRKRFVKLLMSCGIACPNRCEAPTAYASNRTLTDDKLAILTAKLGDTDGE